MQIDIITLFPEMFKGPFDESIIKRAQNKSLVEVQIHQLRKWTHDKHNTVDDHPFGGGVGMLLKVEPIFEAIKDIKLNTKNLKNKRVILLDAGGRTFNQAKAQEISKADHLIFICGRYEGVDHRVREYLIDEEISIGNYVLTGGELPAMVVLDSVVRLIPGVLTKEEATQLESHSEEGVVEYPQYTRPEEFNGWKVPEVLLSGNHAKISEWRTEQAKLRSQKRKA